jgi:hypothetical protein
LSANILSTRRSDLLPGLPDIGFSKARTIKNYWFFPQKIRISPYLFRKIIELFLKNKAKTENVESLSRKDLLDKMFDAAMKERFSELARKYDSGLVFEVWTQIAKGGGVKKYFRKGEWEPQMTIEQALALLDDYCDLIESLIQKRLEEGGGPPILE